MMGATSITMERPTQIGEALRLVVAEMAEKGQIRFNHNDRHHRRVIHTPAEEHANLAYRIMVLELPCPSSSGKAVGTIGFSEKSSNSVSMQDWVAGALPLDNSLTACLGDTALALSR
jgi:hypothetical protein